MRWQALLLVLLIPLAFAAVGDGVCDQTDVLKNSPDCSSAVFVRAPNGGPLTAVYVSSHAGSYVFPVRFDNYSHLPGIVCVTYEGNVGGDEVCYTISPNSSVERMVKVSVPSGDYVFERVGSVVFNFSHGSVRVPVYVVSDAVIILLGSLDVVVSAVLVAVALVVIVFLVVGRFSH